LTQGKTIQGSCHAFERIGRKLIVEVAVVLLDAPGLA
jgi:hypothetical protein